MTISQAKGIFILGTVVSSIIFLALTFDSISKIAQRSHEEKLDAQVVSGKWIWQRYNCNDCHTILGIGGYYAPDVTKVMSYRDNDWVTRFLKDPENVWPANRKMPNLHLKDHEIASVISFLTWVNGIDTNDWPPKPLIVSATTSAKPGEAIYKAHGCSACHMIGGVGGNIGPDLTRVGDRRSREWIEEQIEDPMLHKPDSIMPSFAKLPEKDREALVDYLSGLR